MSFAARLAIVYIVFIDIIGQGLVFPIINSLVMDPKSGFLPHDASTATRDISYGLVIGIFFIAWTLGAPYVAKVSDAVGRKSAMLICLAGALVGYGLTIVAIHTESLALLIIGRAVTGLTAANQPIAQAAMVDASRSRDELNRNLGYIGTATSFGLIGGPLIGGLLSSPAVMGDLASTVLPFYAAFALVAVGMLAVVFGFQDVRRVRAKFVFRAMDIVDTFAEIRRHPVVLRLVIVLVLFHIANLSMYVFVTTFMTVVFGYGEFGNSMVFLTIGVALAIASTFLVAPTNARISRRRILTLNFLVWIPASLAFAFAPVPAFALAAVFVFYFSFGIAYPTFLSTFASSVGPSEQGWVMGMTIAVFTAIGGVISLLGGALSGLDPKLPFFVCAVTAAISIAVIGLAWKSEALRRLTEHQDKTAM